MEYVCYIDDTAEHAEQTKAAAAAWCRKRKRAGANAWYRVEVETLTEEDAATLTARAQ